MVEFDHLITKEKVEENDEIENLFNENSRFETTLLVENAFTSICQGDTIQLERRGYFYVDVADNDNYPGVLHFIPDGKSTSMSVVKTKVDPKSISQGVEGDKKNPKKQEKLEKNKEKKEKKEGQGKPQDKPSEEK